MSDGGGIGGGFGDVVKHRGAGPPRVPPPGSTGVTAAEAFGPRKYDGRIRL